MLGYGIKDEISEMEFFYLARKITKKTKYFGVIYSMAKIFNRNLIL